MKTNKQVFFLFLLFALHAVSMFGGNDYFYGAVTVNASGDGKVYANSNGAATPEPNNNFDSQKQVDEQNGGNSTSAPNPKSITLWAKPDLGGGFYTVTWTSSNTNVVSFGNNSNTATGETVTANWKATTSHSTATVTATFTPVANYFENAFINKCFTITVQRGPDGNWMAPDNAVEGSELTSTTLTGTTKSTSDTKQLFAFVKSTVDGSTYLYHVGTGLYVSMLEGRLKLTVEPSSAATIEASVPRARRTQPEGDDLPADTESFTSDPNGTIYPFCSVLNDGDFVGHMYADKTLTGWGVDPSSGTTRSDIGTRVKLTSVNFPSSNLKKSSLNNIVSADYTVNYAGDGRQLFHRRGVATVINQALQSQPNFLNYWRIADFYDNGLMAYNYTPATANSSTTAVTINAVWNGPFQLSSNVASAHWYWMRSFNEKHNPVYDSSATPNVTNKIDYPFESYADGTTQNFFSNWLNPGSQWAFLGDPYAGLTIVNRATPTQKLIIKKTGDNPSDAHGIIKNNAEGAMEQNEWYPSKNNNGDGSFSLGYDNLGGGGVINSYSEGGLYFWWYNRTDQNNALQVAEVPDDWKDYIVRDFGSYFASGATTDQLFTLTTAGKSSLQSTYNSYASSSTYMDYVSFLAEVLDYMTFPTNGARYRVKSVGSGKYMGWGTVNENEGMVPITTDNEKHLTEISTVLTLTGSDGLYTISTEDDGTNGRAISNLGSYSGGKPVPVATNNAQKFLFIPYGHGKFVIHYDTANANPNFLTQNYFGNANRYHFLFDWEYGGGIANWLANDGDTHSHWNIEPATEIKVQMNAAADFSGHHRTYSTTCLPFDVTLPNDVTAYMLIADSLRSVGNTHIIVPTPIAGKRLPHGTPVMLVRSSEKAARSSATIESGSATAVEHAGNNILRGTYFPMLSDGKTALVLNQHDYGNGPVIGFYNLNNGKKLSANRAYIPYSTLVNDDGTLKSFAIAWNRPFDDEEDAVDGVEEDSEPETMTIYDLQGRRVERLTKGIYIINGKKVLVK